MSNPFAIIRFPGENSVRYYTGKEVNFPEDLSTEKQHFVLHAFDDSLTPNLAFEIEEKSEFFSGLPKDFDLELFNQDNHYFYTQQLYEDLVDKAIEAIKAEKFQKVVHARAAKTRTPENVITKFKELGKSFPDSTVFLIHFPGKTSWLGATPELFLSWKEGVGRTVALAGTSLNSEQSAPGKKELDEQQIIVTSFRELFKETGISEFEIKPAEVLKLGNLAHWQSKIEFRCEKEQLPELLKKLHPTPAVGGFPREVALAHLGNEEKTKRGYYSGYLGLYGKIDVKLYVNLRCTNLFKNYSVAYAGGGITAESIASKEWEETIWKLNSI